MAVCCQNLTLGALTSRSALPVLAGALFKKFGLFLNTPRNPLAWKSVSQIDVYCCTHDFYRYF
jgi:hypothetical protein